jgi:cell division protein FtsL
MSSPVVQVRSRVPRIASAAVEKARLSVVPRARTRAPKVPFVTLVSLVLISGVVGLLLFNTSMQQASFAATALEEQATNLAAREQTLQMELEDLRNPQRVATQAQEMGMVVPPAPTFLGLDGTVRGELLPALPENRLDLAPPAPIKPKILAPAPTIVKVMGEAPSTAEATGKAGKRNGQSGQADKNKAKNNGKNKGRSTQGRKSR